MIDESKVVEAGREMVKNPDWREVLENAPGAAYIRILLAFYASKNLDSMSQQEKDQYREFRETLETQLKAEELKYLSEAFDRMGVQKAHEHYQELYEKQAGQQQPGEQAGAQGESAQGQQEG